MLKQLLTLENLLKALGHTTRWVIIPAIVLCLIVLGVLFISDDHINAIMRSAIASFLFVFVAVTALWICSRWLDWLSKTRFKKDVAPLLKENTLALSIYYSARWVGLAFLVGTVLATVRF